ncbi:hypothetical protein HK096_008050 [Nowakowskiella sp. JEL0078]|nr:hypothetical protein HK096_008050 [Nowakowskiella sp. JEL0078]
MNSWRSKSEELELSKQLKESEIKNLNEENQKLQLALTEVRTTFETQKAEMLVREKERMQKALRNVEELRSRNSELEEKLKVVPATVDVEEIKSSIRNNLETEIRSKTEKEVEMRNKLKFSISERERNRLKSINDELEKKIKNLENTVKNEEHQDNIKTEKELETVIQIQTLSESEPVKDETAETTAPIVSTNKRIRDNEEQALETEIIEVVAAEISNIVEESPSIKRVRVQNESEENAALGAEEQNVSAHVEDQISVDVNMEHPEIIEQNQNPVSSSNQPVKIVDSTITVVSETAQMTGSQGDISARTTENDLKTKNEASVNPNLPTKPRVITPVQVVRPTAQIRQSITGAASTQQSQVTPSPNPNTVRRIQPIQAPGATNSPSSPIAIRPPSQPQQVITGAATPHARPTPIRNIPRTFVQNTSPNAQVRPQSISGQATISPQRPPQIIQAQSIMGQASAVSPQPIQSVVRANQIPQTNQGRLVQAPGGGQLPPSLQGRLAQPQRGRGRVVRGRGQSTQGTGRGQNQGTNPQE